MRTYKVKLLFDNQQIYDFWVDRLYLVRDCYNYASNIIFNENLQLGIKTVHNRIYRELRDNFPRLPS